MGEFLNIAYTILAQEGRPLHPTEIIDLAKERGYLDFSNGETPFQTLKARISEDIKQKGEKSLFKRVDKGIFSLREHEGSEYIAKPFEKTIKPKEDVLVFKAKALEQLGLFNGVKKHSYNKYISYILNKENTLFINRIRAEKDTDFKQILSYILVKKDNHILRFVRGNYSNAHSTLKGRLCIGFGGHVQSSDVNLFSFRDNGYLNSVKRELREELRLPENAIKDSNLSIIGILNDDSSFVGNVHFAIIHLLDLDNIQLPTTSNLKGEKSINQLAFIPIQDLGKDFEKYEYWSKLCIKEFFNRALQIRCKIHRNKNYELRNHPKVIVLAGSIGSGKTEAARILEKEYGYKLISSGKVLQELMQLETLEKVGRERFQNSAYKFIINQHGPVRFADKILTKIDLTSKINYVIDGIRNIKTFDYLKAAIGKELTLIFVDSTVDNSFKFYNKREGSNTEVYEFYRYLSHPVELELNALMTKANIVVYNHGNLKSFETEIKRFFKNSFKHLNHE